MVIPLAAASAVDNAARIVAQRMADNMKGAIAVENQPGAAGLIGAERVARSAPAGTPKEIVARLHAEIVKALADPDVREKLNALGLTARGSSPEELRTATREQLAKYARLIKQAGIAPQ